MNNELNFVLDVLQDKPSIPEKGLDWYWILGFLELNKIGGYFFNRTKELEIKLPQSAERKLSQVLKMQSERNQFMRKYIQDISDELRYEKIRFAFLKGSVLSNTNFRFSEKSFSCMALSEDREQTYRRQAGDPFYGEGERVSNDIDLLVEQKDISPISQILKNMGRENFESIDFKINKIKEIRPDIQLSTEVIVGFPGEGEEEFRKLVKYLDKGQFDDIAVASYEPVKGTKAYNLYNQNPKEIRKARMEYISKKYHAHKYPEPEDSNSLLEYYNEAKDKIGNIPIILTEKARQKYPYIAGTDTNQKLQIEHIILDTFEKILNARDEMAISKLQNWVYENYTFDFREYLYLIFSKTKSGIKNKSKKILLS